MRIEVIKSSNLLVSNERIVENNSSYQQFLESAKNGYRHRQTSITRQFSESKEDISLKYSKEKLQQLESQLQTTFGKNKKGAEIASKMITQNQRGRLYPQDQSIFNIQGRSLSRDRH